MNELTRRQHDVLAKLQELYGERGHPVHYTDLAQRMGINRFSAYDMLRVLESKGAVGSQYILKKVAGRGRPAVAFYPLAQAARQALLRLGDGLNWEQVKTRILARVEQAGEDKPLLDSLLDDVQHSSDPLVYCGRVLAVLIVSLGRRIQVYGRSLLVASSLPEELNVFAGLALGLAVTGSPGHQICERLVEYGERCQQYIAEMDTPTRGDLASFVHRVVAIRSADIHTRVECS